MAVSMRTNLLKQLLTAFFCLSLTAYRLLPVAASSSEPERLSIYAPQARYNLPVADIDGHLYVGAFELIEPLGAAALKVEGPRWKLRMPDPKTQGRTEVEAEFQAGSTAARVRGARITLAAPAREENHRLLLPLHGIGTALIPLLGTDIVFHEAARRLFVGGTAEIISSDLRQSDPPALLLHFPAAVNPKIDSEGNSLKLSFTRDPVVSFTENRPLNDKLFNSTTFAEENGTATLTIHASAPILATFADAGKTIVIAATPTPPSVTASAPSTTAPAALTPQTALESASKTNASSGSSLSPSPQIAEHLPRPAGFLVVIDPAHGGSDTGARITPSVHEKDITLSMGRKLRQELQARHIAVTMLRDSDTSLSFDQRETATNLARPTVFISLHAEPATTLRIYTPALPVLPATIDRNSFIPWQTAQAAFANESNSLASTLSDNFAKQGITAQVLPAFAQPLRSIAAPAIAMEVPASSNGTRIPQDKIARTLADAIAARKVRSGGLQ